MHFFQTSPAHPPAVHNQHVAADIGTSPASQEDDAPLEVIGIPPAAGGDAGRDAGQAVGIGQQNRDHVGVDVAGGDGVDVDAAGGPLKNKTQSQLGHGALAGGVGGDGDAPLE